MEKRVGRPHTRETRMRVGAGKLGIPFETYKAHVEAGQKWCCGCQEWHMNNPGVFGVRRSAGDGLDNICARYARKVGRERMRAARARARTERQARPSRPDPSVERARAILKRLVAQGA